MATLRRIVYMAHPVAGDLRNLERAERWLYWLIKNFAELDFVAPWIAYFRVLDDFNPEDRSRGLAFCAAMIGRCDNFIMVGGILSRGVADELEVALGEGKPVIDLNELGPEPPEVMPAHLVQWVHNAVGVDETGVSKRYIWRYLP